MTINFGIKVGDTFTNKDIDAKALREHLTREYKPGYSGYDNTEYGLVPERYLMEHHGYKDDKQEYKDLLKDGASVEIKSFSNSRNADGHKQNILHNGYASSGGKRVTSLWERKVMWKKDISDHVIFFERSGRITRGEDYTLEYVCDEIFSWDSKKERYISVHSDKSVL